MTEAELHYFMGLLSMTDNYLEFGSGGTTVYAASLVKKSVLSVDSSKEWQITIANECKKLRTPVIPLLHFVDLGPAGALSKLEMGTYGNDGVNYYTEVWNFSQALNADLVMVDGKFRVACFLSALLHCQADTTFLIHDFERTVYAVIADFVDEVVAVDRLVAFRKRSDFDASVATEVLLRLISMG